MSFSLKVKEEILNKSLNSIEKISLLSAYLRNNSIINEKNITVICENEFITNYIFEFFKDFYKIYPKISVRKNFNFKKNYSYILEISKKEVLKDLSLLNENDFFINIPKKYIYDGEEEKKSYLKGVFLSIGSINDPKSGYHLELFIDDYDYAVFICELLDYYELNSKIIQRKNNYLVYIKEAEKISDFLKIIEAYKSVIYFEEIRVLKNENNLVNRLNNCEQANVEKTFSAANSQIKYIEKIKEEIGLELLEDKLKEAAEYRLKYKESSLNELSEIMSLETNKKITKSGLNHRFIKIKKIYNKINK